MNEIVNNVVVVTIGIFGKGLNYRGDGQMPERAWLRMAKREA